MVIVVTGGIGSGKSEVCRMLKDMYGLPIYEADSKAKELYVRHPELLESIEKAFGTAFRNEQGVFQPYLLAQRIFGDEAAVAVVESLLFPHMIADFNDFASSSGNIIIFESATVLEKPQFKGFADKVILVDAPFDVRLDRACRRDGATREQVIARMQGQKLMNEFSEGLVPVHVDEIIMNNGTVEDLKVAVKEVMDRLLTPDIKNN